MPRRLEVELDRQVAHDPRELAAREHPVVGLEQLLAQLLGHDLVEALVERIEGAELAISLAAVFSPTPGTPGMLSVGSPLSAL